MGKTVKISPIKKAFNSNFRTMERSLAEAEYIRFPGTKRFLLPKMEADGRYRTGLDDKAPYINKMSPEAQKAELELIKDIKAKLKDIYPDTDFGNRSKIWNAFSEERIKVEPVALSNSDVFLDLTIPRDLLTWAWVRRHPDIAKSLEGYSKGECPDCQYYIADDDAESKALYSKKRQVNKAIADFESLTPTKQKKIARQMGLPVTDGTTEESVYNMIDGAIKKAEIESGDYKNLPSISVFNDLLELEDNVLDVKDTVEQAYRHSIYRKGPGDKVMEGTATVHPNKEALIAHLLDDKNQSDLLALQVRVKNKKNDAS